MSLIRRKKPDGSTKDWVVAFQRNGNIMAVHFPANQEKKAKIHHEYMLKKLPPIKRHRNGGGKQGNPRKKTGEQFYISDCCIIKADVGIRCEKNTDCDYYNHCLTEAANRNWGGFNIQNKQGVKNV